MGRITFRNYHFDDSVDCAPLEEETGPFEELVEEYYRMQEGFGPYVAKLWDDDANLVYDSEDTGYEQFSSRARDLLKN